MVKVFLIVVMNRMPKAGVKTAQAWKYLQNSIQSVAHHEMFALQPTTQPETEGASHKYGMDYSFKSWMRRRHHLAPEADRVLPLIAAAGDMTRKQIGHAVEIDRDVLDDLLAAMCGAGMLILSRDARGPVYRATAM